MLVGLTGGIASGKSTVADMLRHAGARIIDADRIAREVVDPGKPAWLAIQQVFGDAVLLPDDTIDRKRLGSMVFNDPALRRKLEEIVHPRVRSQIDALVARYRKIDPHAIIVQDVPLLIETGIQARFSDIILVYVPAEMQLQRLIQRDAISRADAQARLDAQMPIEAKRKRASIIIDNSGSLEETENQVNTIYAELVGKRRRGGDSANR
jgi:dephospho-CoA kinase